MYVGEGIHASAQTKEPCAFKKSVLLDILMVNSPTNLLFSSYFQHLDSQQFTAVCMVAV